MRYDYYARREIQLRRWMIGCLLAILFNLALAVTFVHVILRSDGLDMVDTTFEVVTVMEPLASPQHADEREEQPLEREETPEERQQYVSLPTPEREERPDEADFADRFDRRAERDTVNRDDPTVPHEAMDAAPESAQVGAPQPTQRGVEEPSHVAARDMIELERPTRVRTPPEPGPSEASDESTPPAEAVSPQDGSTDAVGSPDAAAESGDPRTLDLREFYPTTERAGSIAVAPARRNDYLDLPESDRTALNSYRSLYWSFFNRMQNALSQEWRPSHVLRLNDPTGQLYGNRDRYTVLAITLNGDGSLRQAHVERTSDLDFLDQEAIRAFQAAAPFHNVPEGLKDQYGLVHFQFGFHVSFQTGAQRIRRLDNR